MDLIFVLIVAVFFYFFIKESVQDRQYKAGLREAFKKDQGFYPEELSEVFECLVQNRLEKVGTELSQAAVAVQESTTENREQLIGVFQTKLQEWKSLVETVRYFFGDRFKPVASADLKGWKALEPYRTHKHKST